MKKCFILQCTHKQRHRLRKAQLHLPRKRKSQRSRKRTMWWAAAKFGLLPDESYICVSFRKHCYDNRKIITNKLN